MEINYLKNGTWVQHKVNIGEKWSSDDQTLNSLFALIDNGDGIISADEIQELQNKLDETNISNDKNINKNDISELNKMAADLAAKQSILPTNQVANDIYDELHSEIGFLLLNQKFNQLNEKNILSFFSAYNRIAGSDCAIISDIINCRADKATKKELIEKIWNLAIANAKSMNIETSDLERDFNLTIESQFNKGGLPVRQAFEGLFIQLNKRLKAEAGENIMANGKIDEDFCQGKIGDCWLLAAIKAISLNPSGLQILNDSIKIEPNGDVTVTLKGVNKTYRISQKELNGSTELSTGDLDIRALEIAFNRYFREFGGLISFPKGSGSEAMNSKMIPRISLGYDIDRDQMSTAYKILLGDSGNNYTGTISKEQIDNFNDPNTITTVSSNGDLKSLKIPNSDIRLLSSHAYTVTHSDEDYVYLINPHDSSTEIKVPRATFVEFFNNMDTIKLN